MRLKHVSLLYLYCQRHCVIVIVIAVVVVVVIIVFVIVIQQVNDGGISSRQAGKDH